MMRINLERDIGKEIIKLRKRNDCANSKYNKSRSKEINRQDK